MSRTSNRTTTLQWTLAAALTSLVGCASSDDDGLACEKCDQPDQRPEPQLCAAVRGNGQLITAHFAALARITEHYGLIDAAAGGSSGSISIFLTESVRKNPNIWQCGDHACSEHERAGRAALLLKSFPGYLQHLATTDEAAAFGQLQPLVAKFQASGIEALAATDIEGARQALTKLLESQDIRDLINPELIGLVRDTQTPEFHIPDVIEGIKKLGNFSADNDRIFLRPGLIDFSGLAAKLGRVASFYAEYGPADHQRMAKWLDACAEPGRGKNWFAVSALPAGSATCGDEFAALVANYRKAFIADESTIHSRIDDQVGAVMPALISTSVVTGASVDSFQAARTAYLAGSPVPIGVAFDDVKFGYFGHPSDLATIKRNDRGYDDAKTAKMLPLGQVTWRQAISFSPAEPGLSRAKELPDGDVSFGGWSDLHPTLVLKNLGCEKVVYVTRRGDESPFAVGIAKLLGMDAATQDALYNLDGDSAFAKSIREAEGTWCTDWNSKDATDVVGITIDSYTAPLESADKFFVGAPDAYPNSKPALGIRGCSRAR